MLNATSLQLPQIPASALPVPPLPASEASQTPSLFQEMLSQTLGNVANQQVHSQHLVEEHLLGHSVTDIEVLTAIKQADIALKTMIQVRNKAVEAFQELKQIQV